MQLKNRHEWVCGSTTSERSDWRRLAYPEMAVDEGEFSAPQRPDQSDLMLLSRTTLAQVSIWLSMNDLARSTLPPASSMPWA
jgi:hypothetical protein